MPAPARLEQESVLPASNLSAQAQPRRDSSSRDTGLLKPSAQPTGPPLQQWSNRLAPDIGVDDSDGGVVQEHNAQLQICREIASGRSEGDTPRLKQGREVIEYHDGTSSITILSKVFGNPQSKKVVRIVLRDYEGNLSQQREFSGLETADLEYLQKKEVFVLPPRPVCDELLRLYFDYVHPYIPMFDPVEILEEYESNLYSTFLIQSLLANVVPYASLQLLHQAGYSSRRDAQKTLFNKAKLLYDFSVEKSHLRLLQGCLALSLMTFSLAIGKDYRFWLSTAFTLATKMGLHKDDMAKDVDAKSRKTCRRLWWVLYNRDLTNSIAGLDNVRRISEGAFDTSELTDDDWEDDPIPDRFKHIIHPITKRHKSFLIANCRLSRITAVFLEHFKTPGGNPTPEVARQIRNAINDWRTSLPPELQAAYIQEWNVETFWVLVLMARLYLFECVFYRTLKDSSEAQVGEIFEQAAQGLRNAMFELDTTVERIMLYEVERFCPLYLVVSISILLALHIEIALSPTSDNRQKLLAKKHIDSGQTYMRKLSESWTGIAWYLRLYDVIVERNRLSLSPTPPLDNRVSQSAARTRGPTPNIDLSGADFDTMPCEVIPGNASRGTNVGDAQNFQTYQVVPSASGVAYDVPGLDYSSFNSITSQRSDDWLQDVLGCGVIEWDQQQFFDDNARHLREF